MASYFVKRQSKVFGPVTGQNIVDLAKSGKIHSTDKISTDKNGPWKIVTSLGALQEVFSTGTGATESLSRKEQQLRQRERELASRVFVMDRLERQALALLNQVEEQQEQSDVSKVVADGRYVPFWERESSVMPGMPVWMVMVVVFIGCTVAYFSFAFTPTFNSGAITRPAVESTEDMLRGMYDKEGIEYDDRMIRDDSRAVEQLHREFGQ